MSILEEKNRLIEEGTKALEQGKFPRDVLESIKDKRLRKDVSQRIFNPSNVKFDSLSKEEKEHRKARLNVKLLFEEYLLSFTLFKNTSYLLLITGIATIFGNNSIGGLITIILGLLLLFVSFSKSRIIKTARYITLAYFAITIIELIIVGIRFSYTDAISDDILVSRRGAMLKIVNVLIPFSYLIVRLVCTAFLWMTHVKQTKFFKAQEAFENNSKT